MGTLARKGLMWKPIHKNTNVLESPKILIKIKEDPVLMKKNHENTVTLLYSKINS